MFAEFLFRRIIMSYHEYIILGAGPAGLQMGYFMQQASRDYLILEGNGHAGSFFKTQPRHGLLISFNKRFNWYQEPDYNLRYDANSLLTNDNSLLFTNYSTELYAPTSNLVRYLTDFAKKFELSIKYNTKIVNVSRASNGSGNFKLTDSKGNEYYCDRLLMATGAVKPNIPDVEGIELAEGYEDYDIRTERYTNKRVVIMGRGNSAFEVANSLAGYAAIIFILIGSRKIKLAWNTHFAGDLRAINNTILDMFQLKMLHAVSSTIVTKLMRNDDGSIRVEYTDELPHWRKPGHATGWFDADHVIRATGFMYIDQKLFSPEVMPDTDAVQKYPVLNPVWESSVPNLYFIGTTMAARERRAGSPFIAGFRYNIRTLFHILQERYHNVSLPAEKFPLRNREDLESLGEHLTTRISTTSALYHMFGELCDVVVFNDGEVEVFYELPVEYALKRPEFANKRSLFITLEFGYENYEQPVDTIGISRRSDPELPGCVPFLHPVFRYYNERGEFVKGRNTRSSSVLRYDRPASIFEGDVTNVKPRHIMLNLINEIARVTSHIFPEDHFHNDDKLGGAFMAWPADDPRSKNHGQAKCLLSVEDQQVRTFRHLTKPSLGEWWMNQRRNACKDLNDRTQDTTPGKRCLVDSLNNKRSQDICDTAISAQQTPSCSMVDWWEKSQKTDGCS